MNDELLDLVNELDQVIGQEYKTTVYQKKLNNFRVINAFVINNRNEIWVPQRSPSKKLFPLCLDASVGGHVMAGETYDQAFARETMEELAIDIQQVQHSLLGKLTPQTNPVSAFMHLYLIHTNVAPDYNKNDFVDARWYSISGLLDAINNGAKTKGDLPELIQALKKTLE